jgi:hypothetical protein
MEVKHLLVFFLQHIWNKKWQYVKPTFKQFEILYENFLIHLDGVERLIFRASSNTKAKIEKHKIILEGWIWQKGIINSWNPLLLHTSTWFSIKYWDVYA